MKPILFSDAHSFHYLYSFRKRQIVCISPVLHAICMLYLDEGMALTAIADRLKADYSEKELAEGCDDFLYFQHHGFLDEMDRLQIVTDHSPESIEASQSNVRVITFELTQRCNLACTYCVYGNLYSNPENNHKRDLTFEMAKAVLDHFARKMKKGASSRKMITLGFYGGEPLLKFELMKQIVAYAKSLVCTDFYFEYTITTNGILLEKYMDFLVENEFTTLISLDGDEYASSYRVTANGKNPFPLIYENCKKMFEKYPTYFSHRVSFNTVLHNRNSCVSTLNFVKRNFKLVPLYSTLSSICVNPDMKQEFDGMYRSLSKDVKQHKAEMQPEEFLRISPDMMFLDKFFANILGTKIANLRTLLCEDMNTYYIPTATCSPFSFKIFLSADGKLHPCEKIGYKYALGYVDEENQLQLDTQQIAAFYSGIYQSVKEKCSHCYNLYSCSTCLFETNLKCNFVSRNTFTERLAQYVSEYEEKRELMNAK